MTNGQTSGVLPGLCYFARNFRVGGFSAHFDANSSPRLRVYSAGEKQHGPESPVREL
jgi:hypothetical protein